MEVLRLHVSQYYGSGDYQAKLDALDTVIKADPNCESIEATLPKEGTWETSRP